MKKSVKKVMACSLAAALAVTGFGDYGVASAAKAKKPTKITMNTSKVLVKVGKTTKLKFSVKPKKASKKVTYTVANKKIAVVNSKGTVKGKKAGTTKVTVKSKVNKKVKAKVTVMVAKVVPTKVTLNKKTANVEVKKSVTLKTTVKPAKVKAAHKKGTWTTSKKAVATVNKNGKVTGKKVGKAKITFTTFNSKKATCTVNVKAASGGATSAPTSGGAVSPAPVAPTQVPPTTSTAPTDTPSAAPTDTPSAEPTVTPSASPSVSPSNEPTGPVTMSGVGADLTDKNGNKVEAVKYADVATDSALTVKFNGNTVEVSATALDSVVKYAEKFDAAKVAKKYEAWKTIKETSDIKQALNVDAADLGLPENAVINIKEVAGEDKEGTKTVTVTNAGDKDGEYTVQMTEPDANGAFDVVIEGDKNSKVSVSEKDGMVTINVNKKDDSPLAKVEVKDGKLDLTAVKDMTLLQ